uniref:Uncharacterized protein n=1 Tax=Knipowitschia caucasica TaxID=637954 RepID=A0AAV2MR59_KNICA
MGPGGSESATFNLAAALPPSAVTFTCHTDFIFTVTTAHLPTLSPPCQSARSPPPLLPIHQRAPKHEAVSRPHRRLDTRKSACHSLPRNCSARSQSESHSGSFITTHTGLASIRAQGSRFN